MLPLTVTIPLPCEIPRQRGLEATSVYGDSIRSRVNVDEKQAIQEAADKCGLSVSMFTRWCATKVAEQIILECQRDEARPETTRGSE